MSKEEKLVEKLLKKFTQNRRPNRDDFFASKFFSLLQDPFGVWCNFHAPYEAKVIERNLYENLRVKKDAQNKINWIKTNIPDAKEIFEESILLNFKTTLHKMALGETAMLSPMLLNLKGEMYGKAGALVKENSDKSVFGNFHYKVVIFKTANSLKDHYSLQATLLTKIIADIQGYKPDSFKIILKDREYDIEYSKWEERLEKELNKWKKIKAGEYQPEPKKPPKAALPPWKEYANKFVYDTNNLVLIPSLSLEDRENLKEKGFTDIKKLATASIKKVSEIMEEPQARNDIKNAKAYKLNLPIIRDASKFPLERKKRNLYFDFEAAETFNSENPTSFIYLIGLWDNEKNKFVKFLAENEKDEEKIFLKFIKYVKDHKNTTLYHWTSYEVDKMYKLISKYPKLKDLKNIINSCVDLKVAVAKSFYVPAPSFSLKAVAPAFGFHWEQKDCGAMDSMVHYLNWQKSKDKALINKVLTYNKDDCVAMKFIDEYLKNFIENS